MWTEARIRGKKEEREPRETLLSANTHLLSGLPIYIASLLKRTSYVINIQVMKSVNNLPSLDP
jgi:hypothetical protein